MSTASTTDGTRQTPPLTVTVIGGGIAGLATAALLARDGHTVTLLERLDQVGGRAGSWEQDGFRFDLGPSWYLMPEVFEHFFAMMGTTVAAELDLVTLNPGYRVLFGGNNDAIDITPNAAENRATFERIEPGSGPQFDRYVASARDTYNVATQSFLYTNFTGISAFLSRTVLRRTGKLIRLLREPLHNYAARYFRDSRLLRLLGYPAVFLGTSPYVAPAMYHLMSHLDLTDGIYYPMGGFERLIAAIKRVAETAGVRIITGVEADSIEVHDGVATGVRYHHRETGEQVNLPADLVVSTADMHHTETRLLPPQSRSRTAADWAKTDPGPGTVLIYLGVRGKLPQLPHHTLMFVDEWHDNFQRIFGENGATGVPNPIGSVADVTSLYVCHPSATDPSVAPTGDSNLFVLVPCPADVRIGGEGDPEVERIADNAIRQIAQWANIPDLAQRITVRRATCPADFADHYNAYRGGALGYAHTTKQSAFFRGKNESTQVTNLLYAGATTVPGIGLPMCLISAELVLKRVRDDRSNGPLPEPAATHNQPHTRGRSTQ